MSVNVNKNEYPIDINDRTNQSNDNIDEKQNVKLEDTNNMSAEKENVETEEQEIKVNNLVKEKNTKDPKADIPLDILNQFKKIYKNNI
ncbi:hypothetical protein CULT_590023 [[Clostridium] ultunense Esp]|uniref:Uncharacterized protein n=1 Tax=[Clostridium] ultunense Esp TaxID=1288971 RepID=M1ZFR2_9FIRM|nr:MULTISPECIES: hypothetical protein [Bacillota]MCF6463197.1 hypothetical protein [Clostridium sp. Cult1]CCQ97194.1 hypothetical protein CULT_590023 [[Clostridium] ultunense Esp]SHD75722.1 conserved protein of unknown function [[Clostridium] ultunense Esp]